MATPKLQPSRALEVIPSAYCEIPFPNLVSDNSLSAIVGGLLTFDNPLENVEVGDIVYSYNDNQGATVVKVISDTEIEINQSGFTSIGPEVLIFKGGQNEGCVLYAGNSGSHDVQVETAGGDIVTFHKIAASMFIPVNVKRVITANGTAKFVALW